jgi:hypothetical protein
MGFPEHHARLVRLYSDRQLSFQVTESWPFQQRDGELV